MSNAEDSARALFNKILSGNFDINTNIDTNILIEIFMHNDFQRKLFQSDTNRGFEVFLDDQNIIKLFGDTLFDINRAYFRRRLILIITSSCFRFRNILAKSEYIANKIFEIISIAAAEPNKLTVELLHTTQRILNQYLLIFKDRDFYELRTYNIIMRIFQMVKTPNNYIIYTFLLDFLTSKVEEFVLTHNEFEKIVFKNQKINERSLMFVLSLYKLQNKLNFQITDYLHMHFITFLSYMVSPKTSITNSLIVSEILESEIPNNKLDIFAIEVINANYCSLSDIIKIKLIQIAKIIPSNYNDIIFDEKQNVRLRNKIKEALRKYKISKH